MTLNIFKKIIYHLKTIANCLSPKIFYSNQLSNQLEVNNNNYSANYTLHEIVLVLPYKQRAIIL